MSIVELLRLLEAKLSSLNIARSTASAIGDIQSVLVLEDEIFETEQTLNKLKD